MKVVVPNISNFQNQINKETSEWYSWNQEFVFQQGLELIELLAPKEKEYILDLGCGDGLLTEQLLKFHCNVLSIDNNRKLIQAAKMKKIEAVQMDAVEMDFISSFDAVFSNAVLHWVKPPEKILSNIYRALKTGGRFVAQFGGAGNVNSFILALKEIAEKKSLLDKYLNPWYFPTACEYKKYLDDIGFKIKYIELIPQKYALPCDISILIDLYTTTFISDLSNKEKNELVHEVRAHLKPKLYSKGKWHLDFVRLWVVAYK